jgi:phosphoserine phosphatase
MSARPQQRRHSARDLETILGVTSALAAPFDLMTMLAEVVSAAKQVLQADRGSVWLYDPNADELVLEVATGIRPVRVHAGTGRWSVRATGRSSTPDCYADPRPDLSRQSSAIARAACSPCRLWTTRMSSWA